MYRTARIESLEARQLLSATPVQLRNGMLTVNGTPDNDVIVLMCDAQHVTVDRNGLQMSFDRSKVHGVVVHSGAGSDMIEVAQGEGDSMFDVPVEMHGGADADMLGGGAGNDMLGGGGGDDFLFGNDGNDTLVGGQGNDLMSGGAGNDMLLGRSDNDTMGGGEGDDVLHGGMGIDELYGEGGNDQLDGGEAGDVLLM